MCHERLQDGMFSVFGQYGEQWIGVDDGKVSMTNLDLKPIAFLPVWLVFDNF